MQKRGATRSNVSISARAPTKRYAAIAASILPGNSPRDGTIRGLEERLGLRLLTRTTRSVAPTEAGERLLRTVGPRFEEIDTELDALSELREKPAGTIRITATDYAADTILWPKLTKFLRQYQVGRPLNRANTPRHRPGSRDGE